MYRWYNEKDRVLINWRAEIEFYLSSLHLLTFKYAIYNYEPISFSKDIINSVDLAQPPWLVNSLEER